MTNKEINENNDIETTESLKEDELGNVSGGLWGITIKDTCTQSFDFRKCFNVLGRCPNLVEKSWNTRMDDSKNAWVQDYVLSCSKGYFYNERVICNNQIPNY